MRLLLFALGGFAAGFASGLLGIGGASVATPFLRFMGVAPRLAIGTTVPVILPTTVTAAWTYHRAGLVDRRAAAWTALAGAVAAPLGAVATLVVDGHLLMLLTAGILLVLGMRILFPGRRGAREPRPPGAPAAGALALGGVAGFFSGLLGIGGGFLLVPGFIRFFRFPVKVALGTSLTVISLTVLPNAVAQAWVGNIDWLAAGLLVVGVVPGAHLGARAGVRAPERTIRVVVGAGVVAIALMYAGLELAALSSPPEAEPHADHIGDHMPNDVQRAQALVSP